MAIPTQQTQIELLEQDQPVGSNPLDVPESDAPILDSDEAVNVASLTSAVRLFRQAAQRVGTGTRNKEALADIAKTHEAEIAGIRKTVKKNETKRIKQQKDLGLDAPETEKVITPDGEAIEVAVPKELQVIEPAGQAEGIVPTQVIVQAAEPPPLVSKNLDPEKVRAVMAGEVPDRNLIDIDFGQIRNAEDLDILTARVEEVFADEIFAAKRGVLSDAEVLQLSGRLGMDKELLTRRVGTMYSAEQIRAAGLVVDKSLDEWQRLKTALLESAEKGVDDLRLAEQFQTHTELTSAYLINFKGAKAEAGRALRAARRLETDASGEVDIVALNAKIQESGGVKSIQNMARMVGDLDARQQTTFFNRLGTYNKAIKEAWISGWYSSVLSAPTTFSRALFGSIDMVLVRPIDSFFGATVGRAIDNSITSQQKANELARVSIERSLRRSAGLDPSEVKVKEFASDDDFVSITEPALEIAGILANAWSGIKAAGKAFRSGEQVYGFGQNIERTISDTISASRFANPDSPAARAYGFYGKVNSIPMRGMMFVDEFAGSIVYETELRRLAARKAHVNIRNGLSADEANLLMADEITNPNSATITAAQEAAKEVALRADLGDIGNWMMKTRSKIDDASIGVPLGTISFGFLKTIINLEKNLLRHSPLSPLLGDVRADLKAGGARRQMAIGRTTTGMAIAGTAYNLTLGGYMTGLGPANLNLKKQMIDQDNWQPCSIKGGDGRYHSIAGLGPISSTICIGSTIAENVAVYGTPGSEEQENLLAVTGLLISRHLQEIPMLGQTGEFLSLIEEVGNTEGTEAIEDAIAKFASGYTKTFVGGLAPVPMPGSALLRQLERTIDPETRSVTPDPGLDGYDRHIDFLFRSWAVGTPMMSDTVKPRRNILGEEYMPITSAGPTEFVLNAVTPFLTSHRRGDPMMSQYINYSIARGRPIFNDVSRTINNIKLNDNELSDLKVYMNDAPQNVTIKGARRSNVTLRDALAIALQAHKAEADEGRFNGLAATTSSVIGQYKKSAWNDPRFQRDYPETFRQILANEIAVKNAIDPIRRRPVSSDDDEEIFDLRELMEPRQ